VQHTKNPYILNPHTLNPHIAAGSGGAAEMQMLEGGEQAYDRLESERLRERTTGGDSNDDEDPRVAWSRRFFVRYHFKNHLSHLVQGIASDAVHQHEPPAESDPGTQMLEGGEEADGDATGGAAGAVGPGAAGIDEEAHAMPADGHNTPFYCLSIEEMLRRAGEMLEQPADDHAQMQMMEEEQQVDAGMRVDEQSYAEVTGGAAGGAVGPGAAEVGVCGTAQYVHGDVEMHLHEPAADADAQMQMMEEEEQSYAEVTGGAAGGAVGPGAAEVGVGAVVYAFVRVPKKSVPGDVAATENQIRLLLTEKMQLAALSTTPSPVLGDLSWSRKTSQGGNRRLGCTVTFALQAEAARAITLYSPVTDATVADDVTEPRVNVVPPKH
jgi:hypothetical protein